MNMKPITKSKFAQLKIRDFIFSPDSFIVFLSPAVKWIKRVQKKKKKGKNIVEKEGKS